VAEIKYTCHVSGTSAVFSFPHETGSPETGFEEVIKMPAPAAHLRSIIDHDGAVILDIEHDAMLTLNSTGGYVWEKLKQGKLIDEIISELAKETNTDPTTVDRDVHAFIDELKSKHLLTA
jgi:Coenzyme PQQ synthesis protein D (PqqD)